MPSASDFFTELQGANTRLEQVKTQLTALKSSVDAVTSATNAVNTSVQQVNTTMATGFGQLVTLATYTNDALHHNAEQNGTIICLLDRIARDTCSLVNYASEQTALQHRLAASNEMLADLYAATHAEAALARQQHEAIKAQVARCCPTPRPEPPCAFEPCASPKALGPPPKVEPIKAPRSQEAAAAPAKAAAAPAATPAAARPAAPAATTKKTPQKSRKPPTPARSSSGARKSRRRRRTS
jgi:hypothetical protein